MRGLTSVLASLLALLMVSTSASGSACDLSCWLGGAHSDCHTAAPDPSDASGQAMATMDMDGMDMGSAHNHGTAVQQMRLETKSRHAKCVQLPAIHKFGSISSFEFHAGYERNYSKGATDCTSDPCRQDAAFTSPPNRGHFQSNFAQLITASVFQNSAKVATGNRQIRSAPPPSAKNAALENFVTILRI